MLARALIDGNYSQYEGSLDFTDPQHLHSTPSRENVFPNEEEQCIEACDHCGQMYTAPVRRRDVSIFALEHNSNSAESSTSTINSNRLSRMHVCNLCHTRRASSNTDNRISEFSNESQYQDAVEQLMSISILGEESDKESVVDIPNLSPTTTKLQLSLDLELGSDGSIRQMTSKSPTGGQHLNIKLSVLPPPSKPMSTASTQYIIPIKTKSTQTQNHNCLMQNGQHSLIRRQRSTERSDPTQISSIWQNIHQQQDRLLKSFDDLTEALLDLVQLCRDSNAQIVVKPFWGHGTFGPTSCFHHFGDPTAVNVLLSTVDLISGTITEEYVAALSLVRCVLIRRSDLRKVFRVEFCNELLSSDDDMDRLLREMCEVFGKSVLVAAGSR